MTKQNISASDKILVLDFGSQYTQLIARKIREQKVYAEIVPFNYPVNLIKALNPKGIILSGGSSSVYEGKAPKISSEIFNLGIPILGICYGFYTIVKNFNGKINRMPQQGYNIENISITSQSALFKGLKKKEKAWISHGDKVIKIPTDFTITASCENNAIVAVSNENKLIYGVQFHPEVHHTENGLKLLKNFVFNICKAKPTWSIKSFIDSSVESIRKEVGDGAVLLGLSGGVDSSVVAALLQRAIGDKLYCVFVNTGFLRKNEAESVIDTYKCNMKLNLIYVDASKRFLKKLKGVTDPEKKRNIIGKEFIKIFMEEANKIGRFNFLAQGTIYPDVIESASQGVVQTIKSHHNRISEVMKLIRSGSVIEPLKELFKDEVRQLGLLMGMQEKLIYRQPFPGPGLAIRIIGEVTPQRIAILQEADDILLSELRLAGLYKKLWQVFAVYLPIKSVGVMNNKRTYENVIAIRAVTSVDAMTADWAYLPENLLRKISNRIINEVDGINRVVLDISSKPPATIEWE